MACTLRLLDALIFCRQSCRQGVCSDPRLWFQVWLVLDPLCPVSIHCLFAFRMSFGRNNYVSVSGGNACCMRS